MHRPDFLQQACEEFDLWDADIMRVNQLIWEYVVDRARRLEEAWESNRRLNME